MLTPQEFVYKWKDATLTERASAQTHFNELCRLLGEQTPTSADPNGLWYAFEKGVQKQGGGKGWADVWKKGAFAWEYKGKGRSLTKAYEQLLRYREALENPPLLVVSDIETILVHTNFTNTVKQIYRFTLDDLLEPAKLSLLRCVWREPTRFRTGKTTVDVTQEAASEFAALAELLRHEGTTGPEAAHFLIRLLFCLFAEDVGLLPERLFSTLIERTRKRPSLFAAQLQQLFAAMQTGGFFSLSDIPHFNGGLFNNNAIIELPREGLEILWRVSQLDWANIEPAIFGTLFERSLDPSKRSQLGAHYTSKEDILLIVEPVLMAPLRREWASIQKEAQEIAKRRTKTTNAGQRTRLNNQLTSLLMDFARQISLVRVLDPAAGSGNFLYVALKALLDLEKEVIFLAGELGLTRFFPSVSPEQLHAIEINEYAHNLSQITVWIGYIQWLRDNGFGAPAEPILKPLETIKRMDALLAYDEQGNAFTPKWPTAEVIIGNPPFLGGNKVRQELGDGYVERLFELYKGRVPAFADLVCYWFERTGALTSAGAVKRAGLLATNSIRGGVNRQVLEQIKESGDIFMAWSDRAWVLDGAAVRVSIVGFDNGDQQKRWLDGQEVSQINADLTSQVDLTLAIKLRENQNIVFGGTKKGGKFDISERLAQELINMRGNPNGRSNRDVIKPWVNGSALLGKGRQKWIIDFGVNMSKEEASLYEAPFEYVVKNIYPQRVNNRMAHRRKYWWLHSFTAAKMRSAVANLSRYIATPRVSKYRIFVWNSSITIPDDGVYIFARDDDYFFGVLHSKLHELWALRMGTWLGKGNDPRYTPTSTFETFPFPWAPNAEPTSHPHKEAIAEAARHLVEMRERWLNPAGASAKEQKRRTLTNLYNQRPTWLDLAHRKLDVAVLDAYGWRHELSDEEILEHLLALNLARSR